jgi:threonine dehydratase
MLFEIDELRRADALVRRYFPPTPQYVWPLLGELVSDGQDPVEVWVKHENHTPTGTFKLRGGLVYLERRRRAGQRVAIVLTGGNVDMPVLAEVLGGATPSAG